ncbi:hypothetical protein J2741_002091 [Methanolinea mesophila]|uniref:hypothetical protein n=1 Tax=Methanolinea mesophila TaxID=547055 RepID=UPI001AE22BC7|nr:hypothetical protein [Methanolinea mesophila]MBP1929544.1 hypothetical protein [Methanolinea mesophila]
MDEEWQPDAIIDLKIGEVKKDLYEYVEKNPDKIDSNIPIFFGHVVAILEKSFPHMSDAAHDRFIDDITVKVLLGSPHATDVDYIEKLFRHAIRTRRRPTGRALFDIILGIKMIDLGRYNEAVEILMKYRTLDAIVCTAIAYSYHVLAGELQGGGERPAKATPSQMDLNAREQMIELARLRPPVNRLKFPQVVQDLRVNKIFWYMLRLGIEWFPHEQEFLKIGLEKAKKDGNREMRGELLKIASERYYNDMFFLRELYHFKLEARDLGGATAVVRQMMQQHPEELEPIYYGMQLSILSSQNTAYHQFRSAAISKKMPVSLILLLDCAFVVMSGQQNDVTACMEDMKRKMTGKNHYLTLIEYTVHDIFSGDDKRVKAARKAFLDSLDQYCLKQIGMKEGIEL